MLDYCFNTIGLPIINICLSTLCNVNMGQILQHNVACMMLYMFSKILKNKTTLYVKIQYFIK